MHVPSLYAWEGFTCIRTLDTSLLGSIAGTHAAPSSVVEVTDIRGVYQLVVVVGFEREIGKDWFIIRIVDERRMGGKCVQSLGSCKDSRGWLTLWDLQGDWRLILFFIVCVLCCTCQLPHLT